jgi:hypothetical protein
MRHRPAAAHDAVMGDRGDTGNETLLTIAVARGQEPVTGTVCAPDGTEYPFSGWSELFAVLVTLLGGR